MIIKEKDIMWYLKSIFETTMIIIFMICLIGFIISWVFMIWNKNLANNIMGFSVCIGFVNLLFMMSFDKDWRTEYRDENDSENYD